MNNLRRFCPAMRVGALFALVVALASHSVVADAAATGAPTNAPADDGVIARVHWLGKRQIAAENIATNFLAIWNLPESVALEKQTLDKLALAPWRLSKGNPSSPKALVPLLRPLLDDLIQTESYLEIRGVANQRAEFVLAIRLSDKAAALWQSNLATVVESWTGLPAIRGARGWSLKKHHAPNYLELARVGDWTLLGAATDTNALLRELGDRIERNHNPFVARATNYWFEADVDFARLRTVLALNWPLFENSPRISIGVIGAGTRIRTIGTAEFSRPLRTTLEAWNIPTNLIHDPLIGFTAIRGFRPWLTSLKGWQDTKLGTPPDEAYFWTQAGAAPLRFCAVPSADASNQLQGICEMILADVNPLIASIKSTPLGSFARMTNSPGLCWRGFPLIAPNLGLENSSGISYIVGGLFPNRLKVRPLPETLIQQVRADPGLLVYDWEMTQECMPGLTQIGQFGRFLLGKSRLSSTNNAALRWLVAIAPRLGETGTAIRSSSPTRISLIRHSTIGFTAFELELLADWLESPSFPKGMFTLEAKGPNPK